MPTDESDASVAAFEPKDRLQLVLKLYEIECADNSELYRRGALLVSGIVFIGTAAAALAKTTRFLNYWPSPGAVLELLALIGLFCIHLLEHLVLDQGSSRI